MSAAAVGVGLGDVADVVAVALQETDHRILGVVRIRNAAVVGERERTVVGDLVGGLVGKRITGRAGHRALVEAVAAVGVVGLPRGIGGLHDDRRVAGVVAHHERDLAVGAGVVVADQVRDIETGDRVAGHHPGRRYRPVATVDQAGRVCGVGLARRLRLGQRRRRLHRRHDLAGAVTAVVAEPQDVDVVVLRRSVDLELDRLPGVDAHLRRKALNRRIAVAVDLPVGHRIARQRVLARDLVRASRTGRERVRRAGHPRGGEQDRRGQDRGRQQHESPAASRHSIGYRTHYGNAREDLHAV